ncbi:MAG TPA: molecular chaperone TorD family protein [Alphaproteobacteria bacterium]|nr:molecular chaperone TorD family protein [Alphaproteobacteria bacterium]
MADEALRQVLSELAVARAQVYGLLSVGFAKPDAALATALWQGVFVRRCQRTLQAALAVIPGDAMQALAWRGELPTCDAVAQALQLEYTRLFIGPHALPAPPYESVYREPLWGVMGETTLAVRQAYEAAGFALDPEARELPDHVAAELEFLACLSDEQAAAWSVVDEARAMHWLRHEHAFLEAHLGQWLPAFAERVVAAAAVPFYSGLARIASGFVAHVRGQLGTMVQALTAASEVQAKADG